MSVAQDISARASAWAEDMVRDHFNHCPGLRAEKVPESTIPGRKTHDLNVFALDDELLGAVEVKSIISLEDEFVGPAETILKKGRKQITKASPQFEHVKDVPCLIVIDRAEGISLTDTSQLAEMMFGADYIQAQTMSDGTSRIRTAIAPNGKMCGGTSNTRISGIALIARHTLSGTIADSTMRYDGRGVPPPADVMPTWAKPFVGHPMVKWEIARGTLWVHFPYLDIVQNPYATHPWGDHLLGPWDSVSAVTTEFGNRTKPCLWGVSKAAWAERWGLIEEEAMAFLLQDPMNPERVSQRFSTDDFPVMHW